MNKGGKLLDKEYMASFLKKWILPIYKDFTEIKSIKLHAYKDYVWEGEAYHVVVEYRTSFITKEDKVKTLPIFCSAHWEEPRKNVYDALNYLWKNGFDKGYLTIPHPLMYSDYYRGIFYRGVEGKHLYYFIRALDYERIEDMVPKAAKWFAKLHSLDATKARNFNPDNSRIETVYPGISHILEKIKDKYPEHYECYEGVYNKVNQGEKEFLANTDRRWVVHGDAHPENIIKMGAKKIAVIDFTDICLSDYTRDLGAFLQQLEFMINRKIDQPGYAEKIKKLFKDNYFAASKEKLTDEVEERINSYYHWTMMRTATHFLLKHMPEPERAHPLINNACVALKVKQ
jgi:hypothetical protein